MQTGDESDLSSLTESDLETEKAIYTPKKRRKVRLTCLCFTVLCRMLNGSELSLERLNASGPHVRRGPLPSSSHHWSLNILLGVTLDLGKSPFSWYIMYARLDNNNNFVYSLSSSSSSSLLYSSASSSMNPFE